MHTAKGLRPRRSQQPNSSAVSKPKTAVLIRIALCFIAISLASCEEATLTQQDQTHVQAIADRLKQPGDAVPVADIYMGEWTEVCVVGAYDRVSRIAATAFQIPNDQVVIRNTSDEVASDSVWGLMMFYPPTTIEYHRIPTSRFPYRSGGCAKRETAALKLNEPLIAKRGGIAGLSLSTLSTKP